ncbi:hydroxymethylbilane synthase, partial [uncultured Megasphaera sp.]
MKRKLTIGTRKSALALWQAEYIKKALEGYDPELTVTLEHIVTKGDKILDVPLARIGGKGLFTTELESRLLAGTIDLAVHSLKDLPADLPDGLCLAAVTARSHVHDAFVSNRYAALDALPQGACVGTSSLRRRAQLLARRPDLTVRDLRGNVDTRLKKLDDGEYDAIILAEAGLTRLGLTDRITQLLPTDTMIPAVGQGALAIETRADDDDLKQALSFLCDEETTAATTAERTFLAAINGSCQVPVGVYGKAKDGQL